MQRIRVVYLVARLDGGGRTHFLSLIRGLTRSVIVTPEVIYLQLTKDQGRDSFLEALAEQHLAVHRIPIRSRRDVLRTLDVIRILIGVRPDILHLQQRELEPLVLLIKLSCRLIGVHFPIVMTKHGLLESFTYYPGVCHRKITWFRMRLLEHLYSRFETKIVTVSERSRQEMIHLVSVDPAKVICIRNSTSIAKRDLSAEDLRALRAQFGIPEDYFVVGTVAAIAPVKGISILVDVAQVAVSSEERLVFLVVGGVHPKFAHYKQSVDRRVEELGLQDHFIFAGQRDDVLDILQLLDVYVHCSITEDAPYSVLEAMALGVPVVSFAVGGIPELVMDRHTGMLVPRNAVPDMGNAIVDLVHNKDLRLSLGAHARERINDDFSELRMVAETESLYSTIIHAEPC